MIDIGSVISGKYRLVRVLGDGGMGSVYEAQHVGLGTRVAIKVLHPELARRSGLVERFLQEARVAAQIRSPHVVQVTDVDRTPDGQAYIVMELLEGEPLSSVLDRQRRLPVPVACGYAIQVLEALEAAHSLGVIHRDLKPENVFVTFHGGRAVLKLIDFGIAKARRAAPDQKGLTVAGVVMGTAEYMAPEQARSADQVDARSDIYAVGVMLYEMIAGTRPVSGDDARIIALKVERGEVIPLLQSAPDTPREIAGPVHRAMAARPELRFATATEMRLALESALTGRRSPTASMSAAPRGALAMDDRAKPREATHAGSAMPGEAFEPSVSTVRAPPIATALAPPPAYVGAAIPALGFDEGRRGRGGRRVLSPWLVGAALLVLAGVLGGVLYAALGGGSAQPGPEPGATPTALASPPKTAEAVRGPGSAPEPARAARSSDVPSLAPTNPAAGPSRTLPPGRPAAKPPADAGANAPPLVFTPSFPSSFPPFPSGLPSSLPPFPTALPSGLPFPSAFPSSFPSWPPTSPAPSAPAGGSPPAVNGATSY